MTALRTTPPGHDVILYDGHCRVCCAFAKQAGWMLSGTDTELRSFRDEGVLAAFPGITPEQCELGMQLVHPDGRVFEGAEAIVQALGRRPLGKLLFVYYVPGLKQVSDWVYSIIARNRFRIAGRNCPDGACAVHMK
jgi:predicted DCC family thiol-disulfide oxidoreductase YuxK